MLNQSVLTFLKKVESDSTLKNRLSGAGANAISKIGAEFGYSFTPDEWAATISAILEGEVSENELNNVAGGVGDPQAQMVIGAGNLKLILPNAKGTLVHSPQ
jgi:predicted ribosomally synthesized peptide with nif11-like leader